MLDYEIILMESANKPLPDRPKIVPDMINYIVEILPLGIRDLRPKGLVMVYKPYLQFKVAGNAIVRQTQPSKRPNTKNPNYHCDKLKIACKMPKDPIFAPKLNISVFDKRLGGFTNALIGRTSIDLEVHMKKDGKNPKYKPPGGDPFFRQRNEQSFPRSALTIRKKRYTCAAKGYRRTCN